MIYSPKELVGAVTVVRGSWVDRIDVLKLVVPSCERFSIIVS